MGQQVSRTTRGRLILDVHTAMAQEDAEKVADTIASTISSLLALATHWGLDHASILAAAKAQAKGKG